MTSLKTLFIFGVLLSLLAISLAQSFDRRNGNEDYGNRGEGRFRDRNYERDNNRDNRGDGRFRERNYERDNNRDNRQFGNERNNGNWGFGPFEGQGGGRF